MIEDTAVEAAELQCLRQEIVSHFTISIGFVAVELAALAAGLSIVDKSTHVLAGLAAVSSLLWLFWINHSLQTMKIAAYIAIELRPRLSQHLGRPVLGWETFLRRVNAGGAQSSAALYGYSPPARSTI